MEREQDSTFPVRFTSHSDRRREGRATYTFSVEAARMIHALPADQLHGGAILAGHHPPAVHLLLVHPPGMMDRAGDLSRVHELVGSGGVRLTRHGEETTPGCG
jgi:hypothetical protein